MQVNCDKCDAWAHFKCAGFRPTVETSFYCIQCKNARKILSNSSSTGRNPKFPGPGNPMKCAGQFTFPVHGMDISYSRKF